MSIKRYAETMVEAIHSATANAIHKGLGIGNPGIGVIKCPQCHKRTLAYMVNGVSGKMVGKCSTPNCLFWSM
jgi:hypothetical protein